MGRVYRLLCVLCLLAAGVSSIGPSHLVAGQETGDGELEGVSGNRYTGSEVAWMMEWDDAVWEAVDARSNQQDNDFLRLEARDDGESFARFSVARGYAGDAQACQRAIAGSGFEGNDEISAFVYVEEGGDALRAAGSYTYTLTAEGGATGDWFLYLECRQLVPGEANLVVALQMPQAEYEESGPAQEELLAGLTLPPGADEPLPPIEAAAPSHGGGAMPMQGGNPARSGEHAGPGPESAPAELWRTEVPEAASALRGLSAPAVADGAVFVGRGTQDSDALLNGALLAFDAATGEVLWEFPTIGQVNATPAVVDGTVYAGTSDGFLYAIDARTAERRWVAYAPNEVSVDPAVVDGTVYFGNNQSVFAVDAETGDRLWRTSLGSNAFPSPAVADGVVYAAGVTYDETGNNGQAFLYALSAEEGRELARAELPDAVNGVLVADGIVYAQSIYGFMVAFRAETLDPMGDFELDVVPLDEGDTMRTTPPVVAAGLVLVTTNDGVLHALDPERLTEAWTFSPDGDEEEGPGAVAVVEDVVYVHSGRTLYALAAADDGAVLWSEEYNVPLSALAVVDGTMYGAETARVEDAPLVFALSDGESGSVEPPSSESVESPGMEEGAYESPNHGYSLTYDSAVWTVDAEDRDPSDLYDEIHLTNGTSYVTITGNPDYAADQLRRCVDDYAGLREQTEGVTALDAIPGTRGQDDGRAFAAYSFSYQSEDYVDYIECRDLGNVTLVVYHNVAAGAYDDEVAAREDLLAGLSAAESGTAD